MAEFSIKRDPDEKFPFEEGLVLTAGEDARKNHSIGLLREETDVFPFRNDPWSDLQEAYVSARIPIGDGPVISFMAGLEKSGDKNPLRGLVDLTASYTGLKDLTLGLNFDYGAQAIYKFF